MSRWSLRAGLVLVALSSCARDVGGALDAPPSATIELPATNCLWVEQLAVTFSTTAGCASDVQRVTVHNRCERALPIEASVSAPFTLLSGERQVEALGSVHFAVQLGPEPRGRRVGTLAWRSLSQELSVGLTADVQPPPLRVDTFHLDAPTIDADVLLVLDDAASMQPIAAHVRQQLDDLGLWLANNGSLRFGVLSSTRGTARFGRLAKTTSGATWLSFPAASTQDFMELTTPHFEGADGASCVEALLTALASGEYATFRRAGVPLQVLCVTNQPDAMEQPFIPALEQLRSGLEREQPWPGAVRVDVVARLVAGDGACGAAGGIDNGRHLALADQFRGRVEDVCARWWPVYSGLDFFGVGVKSVALSGTPDFMRAPITVEANGVALPEGGFWRYDATLNAVVLQFLEGADGRISYATSCAN